MNAPPDTLSPLDIQALSQGEMAPALRRFFRLAQQRRHYLYGSLAISLLCGAAYYVLAPRYYASSAKLLIVEQGPEQLATVGDQASSDNTMATHRELVTSEIVLRKAIDRLSPEHRSDFTGTQSRDWVKTLAEGLAARTTRKTNLIDVSYRSRNPQTAAAVVQAVIDSYLQFVQETHKGAASDVVTVLTQERVKLQHSLAEKQSELQAFRQRVGHLALDAGDGVVEPVIQRALTLNEKLLEAQQRRIEVQSALVSVEEAINKGADVNQHLAAMESAVGRQLMLAGLGLSSQDMQVLAAQETKLIEAQEELQRRAPFFGPNHPQIAELKQKIASLTTYLSSYRKNATRRFQSDGDEGVSQAVRNLLQQTLLQVQQKEAALGKSFDLARAEAARQSGDVVKVQMLEREVARLESLHDVLFDKIATVDMRLVQAPIQATVVREPLADAHPVSPQLRFTGLASLAAGVLVGGALILLTDLFDDRFSSPEEIELHLRSPVLSLVHELSPTTTEGLLGVHTAADARGVEAEAFRTLRTAITLSGRAFDKIAISSAEPGDGKTTITSNLAVAFAQAGKRTLVIDADLRKPGFTALVQLRKCNGVGDLLTQAEPVESLAADLTRTTAVAGLDILVAGLRRANPSELLSSSRFIELLAWAEANYDQVIIDCPPVVAVSDALIVGRLVDCCVLVTRPQKNNRRVVIQAVEKLRSTGGALLGIVANAVSKESGGYGYGYGNGYGYGYEFGGEFSDEDADFEAGDEASEESGSLAWKAASPQPPATSLSEPRRDAPQRRAS